MQRSLMSSAILIIFFVHLVFTTWGLQSDWAPTSYFFYNLLFLLVLLWAVSHNNETTYPATVAFYFNIICLILDVVNVGVFFPSRSGSTSRRFSAGMAIVNMLLRPITTFLLYKLIQERSSLCSTPNSPEGLERILIGTGNDRHGHYQDMERSKAQSINTSQPLVSQLNATREI